MLIPWNTHRLYEYEVECSLSKERKNRIKNINFSTGRVAIKNEEAVLEDRQRIDKKERTGTLPLTLHSIKFKANQPKIEVT